MPAVVSSAHGVGACGGPRITGRYKSNVNSSAVKIVLFFEHDHRPAGHKSVGVSWLKC